MTASPDRAGLREAIEAELAALPPEAAMSDFDRGAAAAYHHVLAAATGDSEGPGQVLDQRRWSESIDYREGWRDGLYSGRAADGRAIAEAVRRVSNREAFKFVNIDWTALGAALVEEFTAARLRDDRAGTTASPDRADDKPDVDDDTFIENVREAITNGCEMACVWCGIGLSGDGMDAHDRHCRLWEEFR